jgi:DNA-binding SARP family transcriptional activator
LLVIAPAGYGKTTALTEAVDLFAGNVAWFSCVDSDREAGRLLVHLVGAVRRAVPGAADVLGERLDGATQRVDVALATDLLQSELERLLVEPLVLVIDDAEHLAGSTEAQRIVADLLAMPLERLRVAVVARRPLELPTARVRIAGRLTELGPAELAFGVEECAGLMLRRTGREPSRDEAEAVWTATEGWPLGVVLAAGSDRPSAARPARAGGLNAYLAEELLDPLEPSLRDAIIDSSVAPELDPALVRALGLPEDLLEEIRRRGIPLRAPAGADGRLAYHPLVRDLLAARLVQERTQKRRARLHAVVGETLEGDGREADAVEHWLAAGRHHRAGELVARHGAGLLATAPATVRRWLDQLSEEALTTPGLRLLEGQLAAGEARLEDAEAPLRAAVAGYEQSGDDEQAWIARAALANSYLVRQSFDATVGLADGYEASEAVAAPMVALMAAAALGGAGRYGDASALFAEAAVRSADGPFAPLVPGFQGFFVDFPCGRLDEAVSGVWETVGHLERADPTGWLPQVLGMAAGIHDERGEPETAMECFVRAERVSEQTLFSAYVKHFAHHFRASLHARAGRLTDAELELSRSPIDLPGWFARASMVTRAIIAAGRGDYAPLEAAIDATAVGPWAPRLRETALLIVLLVKSGRPDRARELVDEALAARPAQASGARLLALRAWLRNLDGDMAGALADVSLAWQAAGDGPQYLLRSERERFAPLVWRALEHGVLAPASVIAALDTALPGGAAVLPFTRHPVPEVRRIAVKAAVASGHPGAAARAKELQADPDPGVASAARVGGARLTADPPPLVFTLLGGFSLRRGAFAIEDDVWRRRAAQRLVRILLLYRDSTMSEDALFAALWPDKTGAAARRNLQVILSAARAVLDWPGTERSRVLVAQRTYRLALGRRDSVDADAFERAAAAALSATGRDRPALLELAASRWTGEPLPEDRYEDWAVAGRERLLETYGGVLTVLANARSAAGDHSGAVDAHRRRIELDPLDEAAQRGLMRAYARSGRRGHALRQYLACRRALLDGLGIEPANETSTLQRLILAGETV